MRIRIGQVFRVVHPALRSDRAPSTDCDDYVALTRGVCRACADMNKGIWAYKAVVEPDSKACRRPAVILLSNPFKEDSVDSPWVDFIDSENGYALYNGDNRRSGSDPLGSRGNALLTRLAPLYRRPKSRLNAPPVLLFRQAEVNGNRKGYRAFAGYGIPVRFSLRSQPEKESNRYFTNLVVELALFGLESENEFFDWGWIDARRDPQISSLAALQLAPAAWQQWVRDGDSVVEQCRRRVIRHRIVRARNQLDYGPEDRRILDGIIHAFTPDRHAFEGLACLVAQQVVSSSCVRGWVTKRSGDGGYDFVCRLDLGSDFSRSAVIVLGQAKCTAPKTAVSGQDLARLVARLQRGWIGVFVTTGVFSEAAQEELYHDNYPIILINGRRLAREVRHMMNKEGISLDSLISREKLWYEQHVEPLDPAKILERFAPGPQLPSLSVTETRR